MTRGLKPSDKAKLKDLQKMIKSKGMSYTDLANLLGYSRGYVSLVVLGKAPITEKFIVRMVKKL